MFSANRLEIYLTALPVVATVLPLAIVSIALALDGRAGDHLWYVATLGLVTGIVVGLLSRRWVVRYRRHLKASSRDRTDAGPNTSPQPQNPIENHARAAALLAAANLHATRAVTTGQLVRDLAHTSIRDYAALRSFGDQSSESSSQNAPWQPLAASAQALQLMAKKLALNLQCPIDANDEPRVDINHAIHLALDQLTPKLQRMTVKLHVDCADTPLVCDGNIHDMQLIFVHLIENAAEAISARIATIPAADDTLAIRTVNVLTRSAMDGVSHHIAIADQGIGLSLSNRECVFAPTWTTKGIGRGAGLAVCRHLLTRLGGSLELLDSSNTGGITAHIWIPASHSDMCAPR